MSKSGRYFLRFGLLALVILISLGGLYFRHLKFGTDIAGGYSLVFEIYPDESNDSTTVKKIISILKRRIDPTGVMDLTMRPLQDNRRFEVRMPAPSKESLALRQTFFEARDELFDTNIDRPEIRELLSLEGEARAKKLAEMTGQDVQQAKRVNALLQATEILHQAEKARKAVIDKIAATKGQTLTKEQLDDFEEMRNKADGAVLNAMTQYRESLSDVRSGNINRLKLMGLLKLYDQTRDVKSLDDKRKKEELFQARLDEFKTQYATRADLIDKAVAAYQDWATLRQPLEDPNDLRRLIRKAGVLEFRIAPWNPSIKAPGAISPEDKAKYIASLNEQGPEALLSSDAGYGWFPLRDEDMGAYADLVTHPFGGKVYLLLCNRPGDCMLQTRDEAGKNAWELASARPGSDNFGAPAVNFTFDAAGAKRFAKLTSAHKADEAANKPGRLMAILLDDEVYSAPAIRTTIDKSGQITGSFTIEEVQETCNILQSGSLPAKINPNPVSERHFGAAMGEVNMHKALRAGVYGMIAVAVFMLIYYLLCGALADAALCLNIVLVLGAMSWLSMAMTLPGIAGVILTIGMAVDANVLIFERLREEQRLGLGVRQAIKNAYDRAFSAILDANITTLLICVFLYFVLSKVGMEEVRGFAVTLGFGVAFSMFTALLLTRWIFELLMDVGLLKKPLPMLRLIPKTNINWMGKRHLFWIISLVLIVVGIGSLIWQGKGLLGIQFSAGTQATVVMRDDALIEGQLPNDALIQQRIFDAARNAEQEATDPEIKKKYAKLLATAQVESIIDDLKVAQFLELYGNGKGQVTLAEWKKQRKNPVFFEKLNTDGNDVLDVQELQKLPYKSYQLSTTLTDSDLVRDVLEKAFGDALQERRACTFTPAANKLVPELGVYIPASGAAQITEEAVRQSTQTFRGDLEDNEGGIVIVMENVNPPITPNDATQRVREMRMQPDFGAWAVNPFHVVGLKAAGPDGCYSTLAMLVSPSNADAVNTESTMTAFRDGELSVFTEALKREDAMILTKFDPSIAGQTAQLAVVVIVLSWLTIVAYLWLRFGSVKWGLAAVLCLVHDVIIVLGLVAASGWLVNTGFGRALGIESFKVDLAMVAALLTVIGYSVNDTIVVFDRIRENRGKLKHLTPQIINNSINQTLPRTLLTSLTTFMVVLVMYIWGGPGIKAFNYALLMGIVFGTYSSVAVASPMLMGLKKALIAKVVHEDEDASAQA